jgi:hypothetical protein
MLYPDSEKRIKIINEIADVLKSRGYLKTAKEAASFADMQRESEFPADLSSKFNGIINIFAEEFKDSLIEGKTYRAKVFEEIEEIVVGAVNRTYPKFFSSYSEISPILTAILNGRNTIGDIADEIVTIAKSNKKIMFLLCCYGYLIMVEGVFDEISRVLYFFSKLTESHVPRAPSILNKDVGEIIKEFSVPPVFLENWEEKKHIRNAIAHATTYFDPAKEEVRFVDAPSNYDKTKSLHDFLWIVLEFDDLAESFSIILCLLELLKLFAFKELKLSLHGKLHSP